MADLTQDEKDKLYADWEAEWLEKDFSWAGLAKYEWKAPVSFPGEGEIIGEGDTAYRVSNLQEYWRWSPGVPGYEGQNRLLSDHELNHAKLITTIKGSLWHVLHIKDTNASTHTSLAPAILARLKVASGFLPNGPDNSLLATGARARKLDQLLRKFWSTSDETEPPPRLNIDLIYSDIEQFDGHELVFGDVWFSNAIFSGSAVFKSATFTGTTSFESGTFTGDASFESATFVDATRFDGSKFMGSAWFDSVTFAGDAKFDKTRFVDRAWFEHVKFSNNISFENSTFLGVAWFDSTTFTGETSFFLAKFEEEVWFDSATFTSDASFDSVSFSRDASFDSVTFVGDPSFDGATFENIAYFSEVKWGWDAEQKKLKHVHYGRAFISAKFRDTAYFETDLFSAFAALDGAQFDKALYLRLPSAPNDPKRCFNAACRAVEAKIKADCKDGTSERDARTERWGELSSGYKTVKAVMERDGDFDRAQLFHRFEIQARMKQPRIGGWERAASWIYGTASDYGGSLWRPLAALGTVWLAAVGIYIVISFGAGEAEFGPFNLSSDWSPTLLDAVSLSTKSALLNLDSFGGSAANIAKTSDRLFGEGGWAGMARFIGIVQTFFSFIFAFFFGLAVRRKFQIR